MRQPAVPVHSALPGGDGWDFGDFPYALEPLWLPPDVSAGDELPGVRDDLESACRRLSGIASAEDLPFEVEPVESADRLFWFRWITGHQLTFVLWHLAARTVYALRDMEDDDERGDALRRLAHYVRGYGAMLLYTSSTPRDVYADVIRPSMFLQHRGFSGGWAPDFGPVRELLRGRRIPCPDHPEAAGLRRAVGTVTLIHTGIAARLVPGGRSLLRQAVTSTRLRDPHVLGVLYDNYFIVLRAPTSLPDVVTQLLRRVNAVALDVRANGLYPAGAERGVAELEHDDVLECERDFLWIMTEIAGIAAGAGQLSLER
jgi:hypothetical protein